MKNIHPGQSITARLTRGRATGGDRPRGLTEFDRKCTYVLYILRMALPSLCPRCEELENQVASPKGTMRSPSAALDECCQQPADQTGNGEVRSPERSVSAICRFGKLV